MRRRRPKGLPTPVDQALKIMAEKVVAGFLHLAGEEVHPQSIRPDRAAINIAGLEADRVFVVEEPGKSPCCFYLEFVLQPKPKDVFDWELKKAALRKSRKMPVILVAIYLEKGRYKTFPDRCVDTWSHLTNEFRFPTIKIWEHTKEIRSGKDPRLAPLYLLCVEEPTEETMKEVRQIIHRSHLPAEEKHELLAVALVIGSRYFTQEVLKAMFVEEKDLEFFNTVPFISELLTSSRTEGKTEGKADEARQMALKVLRKRFGEVPAAVAARVEKADAGWCEAMVEQALEATTLGDLNMD